MVVADPFLKQVASEDSEPAKWKTVYEIDFSGNAVGEEPEDLFILDGSFSVQQEEVRKSLGGNHGSFFTRHASG